MQINSRSANVNRSTYVARQPTTTSTWGRQTHARRNCKHTIDPRTGTHSARFHFIQEACICMLSRLSIFWPRFNCVMKRKTRLGQQRSAAACGRDDDDGGGEAVRLFVTFWANQIDDVRNASHAAATCVHCTIEIWDHNDYIVVAR